MGRYKEGSRVNMTLKVRRSTVADGNGRVADWYIATGTIAGKTKNKKFSVDKYGEDGARMLATLQRMMFLIKCGAWDPGSEGVMEYGSYMDIFAGNRDYENAVITERCSPDLPRSVCEGRTFWS